MKRTGLFSWTDEDVEWELEDWHGEPALPDAQKRTEPVTLDDPGDWRGDEEVGDMPYEIEKRGDEYCVVKEGGEVEKCHPTKEEATAHLRALYANVEDADKAEDELRAMEQRQADGDPFLQFKLPEARKAQILDQVLEAAKEAEEQEAAKGQLKKLMQEVEDLKAQLAAREETKAAPKKKEEDGEHPAGHYLVVEDPDKPGTWHLRVRNADGDLDHRLMGAAWAATHGGYRGNVYQGPDKDEAIAKLKKLYEAEGMDTPGEEKARGEGQGVGGPVQGDGGTDACVCPECGAEVEHERGTPCAEVECPECGAMMVGKDEKDRQRKSVRERLKEAYQAIKDVLGWADYEDAEPLFKGRDAGLALKTVNGEPWLLTWSSNAFIDRDEEIFTTKGLEQFVQENEQKEDRGHFNFWHVPGTDFAEKRWQGVIGRFLVEAGPFTDDARGRAARKFFTENVEGHPEVAPEGWGASVEYRYLPEEKKSGVYERFWITRTSVLPRLAAANTRTRGGVKVALTKKQKEGLEQIFPDEAEAIIGEAEAETKKLEEAGVEHKSAEEEKAMDAKAVAKAIRKLAGDADEKLAARLEALAKAMMDEDDDEEPEEEEEKASAPPEIDLERLGQVIAKQFDVQLEPLAEMREQIADLQAQVRAYQRAEKTRQSEETPRFVLSLEKRASEAGETALDEEDPLLKMKPAETKPDDGSGASHFFPSKK